MLRLTLGAMVWSVSLYMGEISECDEVTECRGGKNWQVGRRNNNGRVDESGVLVPTTVQTPQKYQQSISMKFHWYK
jgi:hypothetical protein